jgi:thymidine phosphorylase
VPEPARGPLSDAPSDAPSEAPSDAPSDAPLDPRALIACIRDGGAPRPADLRAFAAGLASGAVGEAQAGAFAMAVLLRGLGEEGRVALTLGMRDSGRVLAWGAGRPVVDKHSTGGVGDCVSLLLAPMLAACGAAVPMISGRGLGHTGGTLDKLEAIPGLRTDLDEAALRAQVEGLGCAIVAASHHLAPADRRLYAIRDVTATVESVDLITASILSKKLAAGLGALVLDVKVGSGAFLPGIEAARRLARALVSTACGAGCATVALLTDMDRPLIAAAGNALEVAAVVETLAGRPDPRLVELTVALGAEALVLAGLAADPAAAAAALRATLDDGRAAEGFARMVAAQGGPADLVERPLAHLPRAPLQVAVPARAAGVVAGWDTRAVGEAVVHLGAGRLQAGARIDPAVGLDRILPPGTAVAAGDPVAVVHAADEGAAARAVAALQAALRLAPQAPPPAPLLLERIG